VSSTLYDSKMIFMKFIYEVSFLLCCFNPLLLIRRGGYVILKFSEITLDQLIWSGSNRNNKKLDIFLD